MVGIDQIAAQRPQPRQNAILVRAREPAIADHVRDQDRRNLPGLAHGAPSGRRAAYHKTVKALHLLIERIEPKEGSQGDDRRMALDD